MFSFRGMMPSSTRSESSTAGVVDAISMDEKGSENTPMKYDSGIPPFHRQLVFYDNGTPGGGKLKSLVRGLILGIRPVISHRRLRR